MLRKSVNIFALVCVSIGVLGVPAVKAQTSSGTIVGHIQDASGAAVPGTQVTVTNLGTSVSFRYTTDNSGDYYFPALLPGRYRVAAEKTGFKKEVADSVTVDVNQTVREDFTLQVGQTTQTVEVTAAPPMLSTDQATLGTVITNREVTDLPLNGRDFTNLIRLNVGTGEMQGGITTAATIRLHGYDDNWKMVSVDGSRPASVSVVIDGVPTNDEFFQSPANVPTIDAIQEFKLQNGLYGADFGMGAAQVSVAIKSGSNSLHGAAWDFFRNEALQPANPRASYLNSSLAGTACPAAVAKYGSIQIPPCTNPRPPFEQNQFGFTLGGPVEIPHIYRGIDRTFWFFNYQGGRRLTSSLSYAQVPTAAELTGNFSDWLTACGTQPCPMLQLYDTTTGVANPVSGGTPSVIRQPFAGNVIPTARFATISKNLLPYWPAANLTCALPCSNYQATLETANNMDQYLVRLDHTIGQSDRIFGEFMWQKQVSPLPSIIPLSGANATQSGRLGTLRWGHSFGPRTLNEAWFGFNRVNFAQVYQTAFGSTNYWAQVGLTNLWNDPANYGLPAISLGTGYTGVGFGGTSPFWNITNTYQYADNLTMTRGRQTMKMGVDIRRNQGLEKNGSNDNGLLTFGGNYTAYNGTAGQTAGAVGTGNGFADFLLGYMTAVPKFNDFPQTLSQLRNTDYMFFYQDDVRVTPQLTLNLGLRYELHMPFHDLNDGGSIINFSTPGGARIWANSAYAGLVSNSTYFGCCVSPTLINTDTRDFAPRIGFAWRPWKNDNKFVVRGGYGMFYDVLQEYYNTQSVSWDIPYVEPTLPTPNETETTPPLQMGGVNGVGGMFPAPYTIAGRNFPAPYCKAPSSNQFNAAGTQIIGILNYCPNPQVQLQDNKTPSLQQWGLNLQYALTPTTMLELGYQGSHGVHEPIQWIFNQAYPVPTADTGFAANSDQYDSQCTGTNVLNVNCFPTQDRVPYPNFAQNSFANANILGSRYEAMTFKVDKRYSHGVQTLVSFTWSHAIDQFSEIQAQTGTISSIAVDAHNLKDMWGSASFDETLRLVSSGLYELPVGKGKALLNRGGVVNRIMGGWQVNGILTLSSGPPFDVGAADGDREQVGNSYNVQKPNELSDPRSGFTKSVYEWFNPAAFGWVAPPGVNNYPPLGTLGNFGRNVLRATHQTNLDFSAFKNNQITERVNLQFRAEFFNVTSSETTVPLFPSNTMTSSTFGDIINGPISHQDSGSLFNPRVIQLSLKLLF
jgi:hypothetical protein